MERELRRRLIRGVVFGAATAAMVMFIPIGSSEPTPKETSRRMYRAFVANRGGAWVVVPPDGVVQTETHVEAELTERVVEYAERSTRSEAEHAKIHRVVSTASADFIAWEGRADRAAAATDVEAADDVRVLANAETERWQIRGTPARWMRECRDTALAYFAEERPDLVDRVRAGEAERELPFVNVPSSGPRAQVVVVAIGMGLFVGLTAAVKPKGSDRSRVSRVS